MPWTGQLKQQTYFITDLEAGSPRSRCPHGWIWGDLTSCLADGHLPAGCPQGISSVHPTISSSSDKNTSPINGSPHPSDLRHRHSILKDPVSQYILSEVLEVRTWTYEFREETLHPVTSGLSRVMVSGRNETEDGTAPGTALTLAVSASPRVCLLISSGCSVGILWSRVTPRVLKGISSHYIVFPFPNVKNEAQRGQMACPRSHSKLVARTQVCSFQTQCSLP